MQSSILHAVEVVNILEETPSSKTFVLQPLHGWQPKYKPGQFITLIFTNTGTEKRRSYSLVPGPAADEHLRITVKRVENGEYSRYMLDHVVTGRVFETTGITGFFVLPAGVFHIEQFFFLAAGSGITPVYSIIKELRQQQPHKEIVLVYSNRNISDVIFKANLELLEKNSSGKLKIVWLFSSNMNVQSSRLSNYLLNMLLKRHLRQKQKALFYMCGPFEYMLMIQITLLSYGVQASQIFKEQFSTLPRIVKAVPPDTSMHRVDINVISEKYSIEVQYPSTILAAAKSAGIVLPYSCEAGRCGSCAATCTKGKTWMAYNEVLTDEEVAAGRVLLCQAYPVGGDVSVKI